VEQNLRDVPRGVIEAAQAMGASDLQIVTRVLLVEARSGLVLALTVLAISFLSYSAVAGVVGGGGIGDLAIRYGYYRFQTDVMVLTVAILVVLVQLLQAGGNALARRLDKR
jgi:D-methionine transport system permease protein